MSERGIMKTIVITGATSGLGKELVTQFAKDGNYKVFAGYRNSAKLEQLPDVEYFYIDLMQSSSIVEAAEFIKSKVNKVDILINTAGAVVAGPVEVLPAEKLREQFQINTFSHIEFTQNLLPVLEGSRILNISSMASFGHFPFISPYCASKRSLDIFFNAFALENHKNIEVVSIKPGVIATPIWEKSVKSNEKVLDNNVNYALELKFLKNNALSNTTKGLDVSVAARKIKNIAQKSRIKSSYLIGKDAVFAQFLSYFPQDFVNFLIKLGLKLKLYYSQKSSTISK